jgi:hypothetical protein
MSTPSSVMLFWSRRAPHRFAGRRDAWLQAEELDDVARHQRQLPDLHLLERVADRRVRSC